MQRTVGKFFAIQRVHAIRFLGFDPKLSLPEIILCGRAKSHHIEQSFLMHSDLDVAGTWHTTRGWGDDMKPVSYIANVVATLATGQLFKDSWHFVNAAEKCLVRREREQTSL